MLFTLTILIPKTYALTHNYITHIHTSPISLLSLLMINIIDNIDSEPIHNQELS